MIKLVSQNELHRIVIITRTCTHRGASRGTKRLPLRKNETSVLWGWESIHMIQSPVASQSFITSDWPTWLAYWTGSTRVNPHAADELKLGYSTFPNPVWEEGMPILSKFLLKICLKSHSRSLTKAKSSERRSIYCLTFRQLLIHLKEVCHDM